MNTVTLLQLHEKAIKTLECIELATSRIREYEHQMDLQSVFTHPWHAHVSPYYTRRLNDTKAALERLKAYYFETLCPRIEAAQRRAFENQ